jgi:hypothetical protein
LGTSTSSSLGRTRTRRHRRFDVIVLAVAAPLLAGAAAALGVAAASTERVTGLWAAAAVDTEGNGRITEVIDYDFGRESRHGIFRDVPGLRSAAPIIVKSATAPADVLVEGSRIRIGNPSQLVTADIVTRSCTVLMPSPSTGSSPGTQSARKGGSASTTLRSMWLRPSSSAMSGAVRARQRQPPGAVVVFLRVTDG